MEYTTTGRNYNKGKVAYVKCIKNGSLSDIRIKDRCFLLILLTKGKLEFSVGEDTVSATAPAFLCFDETNDPTFSKSVKADYICIYFHPKFLNVNMCFGLLRAKNYGDIATTHDMFMLKPFIDKAYVVPICDTHTEKTETAALYMAEELEIQRDWYWSCRSRSYFMEIIITLERMYGLMGYGNLKSDNTVLLDNPKLRDAVLYIEGHFGEDITLADISAGAGLNHTTLTSLMKRELGCTAMEYLTNHRISIAKKRLAFTDVPIKDVADSVGFKTVQHFSRVFKKHTGKTPADFRKHAVLKRKKEL